MAPFSRAAELAQEQHDLAMADQHIYAGEGRVTRQLHLIDRCRSLNLDVRAAEALLKTLIDTLELWRGHRTQIIQRIAYLEAFRPGRF
jgi:hypothetical protein